MKTYLIILDNGSLYRMEAETLFDVANEMDGNPIVAIIDTSSTKDLLKNLLEHAVPITPFN